MRRLVSNHICFRRLHLFLVAIYRTGMQHMLQHERKSYGYHHLYRYRL
jgi:hypothetical protein